MFDKNFYPTPENIALKMTAGIINKIGNKERVLEPSAGSGSILDVISRGLSGWRKSYGNADAGKNSLYAIEKQPELRAILLDKGYRVVHDDFLTYKPDMLFDYIIMNPPFDNGAKHLLKALEISNGAEIRCLLNAETINNPYSKERELLLQVLSDNNASYEHLGQCFSRSERPTDVEIVLVTVKKQADQDWFKFEPKDRAEKHYNLEDVQNNQVARYDALANMESRYDACCAAMAGLVKAIHEIHFYSEGLIEKNYDDIFSMVKESVDKDGKRFYNNFIEKFRGKCWDKILNGTKIQNIVTGKVKDDFYKNQQKQGAIPFTAANIENLFYTLYDNQETIFQNCINDAFDLMTAFHKENRVHIEGWKTNDRWKVNRKVILPGINYIRSWEFWNSIADIEKALCFIAGKKYEDINSIGKIRKENNGQLKVGNLYDSEFFTFRVYLKGTIHLTFKDDYIYEQFNLIACKGKNWLKSA